MKQQLFFHLGTPKTGTTSMQRALRVLSRSRSALNKYYLYPEPIITESHMIETCLFCREADHVLPNLSWAPQVLKHLDETPLPNLKDLIDSWAEKLRSYQSEINLPQLPPLVLSCEFAYQALGHQKAIRYLRERFSDYDVNFILYLRRIDMHVNSALMQTLKRGNWSGMSDYQELKHRTRKRLINRHLEMPKLLNRFGSVFGNHKIMIRPFDRACLYKGDVVSDFFRIIGLELPESYDKSHKNITLPYDFLIYFVHKFGNPVQRSEFANKLLTLIMRKQEVLELQTDSSKFAYSPQERLEMNEAVSGTYKELQDAYTMKAFPSVDLELVNSSEWFDLSNLDSNRLAKFDQLIADASSDVA